MKLSLRILLLGWLCLTGWQLAAQSNFTNPQAATLAVPLVGQTPPLPTRGSAPGFPALMNTNEGIRRQNEVLDADRDLYLAQKRQAQATIDEAVADFNRRKGAEPAKVLKESDLSDGRKAQLYAALRAYEQVYQQLKPMYLGQQPYDLKRAVYLVENAYLENSLSYQDFCAPIHALVRDCWQQIPAARRRKATAKDKHLAIFQVMCDTTRRYDSAGKWVGLRLPMRYDFHDYRGEADYRQQFVTKLLQTNTGQCHSLPLLYKILAEEMGLKAYLAFAPNHSYIRHQDEQGRWYNLELTNGRYVTSHALMSFGYIKTAALKNRVYLDTLSRQQTIGACLVDLVLGYDAKFGDFRREAFMHQCIDGVLQRQPNYVEAWMVKGGLIDSEMYRLIRQRNYRSLADIPSHSPIIPLHQLQLQIYDRIESLGFARMPAAQYEAWRASLGREQSRRKSR